jgi:hypothetical protein
MRQRAADVSWTESSSDRPVGGTVADGSIGRLAQLAAPSNWSQDVGLDLMVAFVPTAVAVASCDMAGIMTAPHRRRLRGRPGIVPHSAPSSERPRLGFGLIAVRRLE